MSYGARVAVLAAFVYACMLCQLALLEDVTVNNALPLHLCSFAGVLTPLTLSGRSRLADSFTALLGLPGAALALCFPAVPNNPDALLTQLCFMGLHGALVYVPFLRLAHPKRPLRPSVWRAMALAAVLFALAMWVNARFNTNYLFLRLAPAGTPLRLLGAAGTPGYALTLMMLALGAACLTRLAWKSRAPTLR